MRNLVAEFRQFIFTHLALTSHQDLSRLLHRHPAEGKPLPELHQRPVPLRT
jgi:hypothetical protein